MKKLLMLLCAVPLLHAAVPVQEQELKYPVFVEDFRQYRSPFSMTDRLFLTGYVKTDVWWDSRQVTAARDGHFLVVPTAPLKSAADIDLRGPGQFNILPIESRVRLTGIGPDAFGAKTLGMIEADFFGRDNVTTPNMFRVYFACLNLKWNDHVELLMGQYWHPIYVEDCSPDRVGFGSGAPYEAHPRSPQIRFTYHVRNTDLIAAAMSELDFSSNGPTSPTSDTNREVSQFLRDSLRPILHFQVRQRVDNHLIGAGIDIRHLRPRLQTSTNIPDLAMIHSLAGTVFAKFHIWRTAYLKTKLIYGGNLGGYRMLGGYGIGYVNPATGSGVLAGMRCYKNLRTWSWWAEFGWGTKVQPGIFIGYSKNIGARQGLALSSTGAPIIYSFLGITNIDHIWRVSPRIKFFSGPVELALEIDYNRAAYGTTTACGKVINACPVNHVRFLAAAYYMF